MSENEEKKEGNGRISLVSLKDIYTGTESLQLYIINEKKDKLKHITTKAIKPLESEVCLYDVLMGTAKTTINPDFIQDARGYFKIDKQIGFNPHSPYDFRHKSAYSFLCNLSTIERMQEASDAMEDFKDF